MEAWEFFGYYFLKMFDSQIKPILLYGSENFVAEGVQISREGSYFCLKKKKKTHKKTTTFKCLSKNPQRRGVRGDRSFSFVVLSYTPCVKYRLPFTTMDTARLPRKAYTMLLSVHKSGRFCWASLVHQVLYTFWFGFVWENYTQ